MTMRDGWVRVDERLPDEGADVLVWFVADDKTDDEGHDLWLYSEIEGFPPYISHWQPIEGPGDGDE